MEWHNIIGQYLFLLSFVSAEISVKVVGDNRLPNTVVPVHYILRIGINDIKSDDFIGWVVINFHTREATNNILIHASPTYLNITKIILNEIFENPCNVTNADRETEIITITCMNATSTEDINSLSIKYQGSFTKDGEVGLYRSSYEENGVEEVVIATQLAPSYARRVFPCFDEPRFKAAYDIFITLPHTHQVLGNTPIQNIVEKASSVEVEFASTPPMATYLIGFLISKLEPVDKTSTYKVYTRPELSKYTGTAMTYTPNLIQLMGEWTGIKYEDMENRQLYQVALEYSKFPSTENWGLIMYRENLLLDGADKTTQISKQRVISNMAHAISQQWFGAYVTPDYWSNAWLDEGFATFFEYHLPDQITGLSFEYEKQFVVNVLQSALEEDAFFESQPLSSGEEDIKTTEDCMKNSNGVTSAKGASLIRMMRSMKGEENFQNGIKSYLTSNKFNSTNPTSLLKSLHLENMMENWIYKSGYPLLTVKLNNNQPKVTVTQEKFRLMKNETDEETQWNIPVSFATSTRKNFDGKNKEFLEEGKDLTLDLEDDSWIILNVQQMGFYRVNYDETLWNRIIKALKGNDRKNIHVLNRAQLLDDVFNLARVGKTSYVTAFGLAEYLRDETEYYPWVSVLNAISYLLDRINDDETKEMLNSRTSRWINAAFPSLNKVEANDHVGILKETLILKWKCQLQDSDCLEYVNENFESYKNTKRIENNEEKNLILCYGVKNSQNPQIDYNFLLNIFQNTDSVSEREDLLFTLGCFSDANVFSNFLLEIVAERSVIPQSYALEVFRSVHSNNEIGVNTTLLFLERNIQLLMEKHRGIFTISDFIVGLADKIKTRAQLEMLQEIIENNPHLDDLQSIGPKLINRINYHLVWSEMYTEAIKTALPKTSSAIVFHPNYLLFLSTFIISCIHPYLL